MDEDYREYAPHARPDVEVLVDDTWYAGEVRAWHRREGSWWANVTYRTGTAQQYSAVVSADRVRQAPEPPPRPVTG